MTREEILRMVEEVEAELGDGSTDHYSVPEAITEGQLRELCRAVQRLIARLEKLEAVTEAARKFHNAIYNEKNAYETWPDIMESQEVYEAGNRLRQALAALEEVEG